MELPGINQNHIQINPDAVDEVNQKIQELKETLDKHGVFIVFNTEIGEGFLFPKTYKVCSCDDPECDAVDNDRVPMSIDGTQTQIGQCLDMYDDEYQLIIPA